MKKIIPILTLLSMPVMLCACNTDNEKAYTSYDNYKTNINNFQKNLINYANNSENGLSKLTLNKYKLTFALPENNLPIATQPANELNENNENELNKNNELNKTNENGQADKNITTLPNKDFKPVDIGSGNKNSEQQNNGNENQNEDTKTDIDPDQSKALDEQQPTILPKQETQDKTNTTPASQTDFQKISTLYTLTKDVDNECNAYCQLKTSLVNAITETNKLIDMVNNNELELTNEQRLFLTEQSHQLKNLGRQLSTATTQLSFSLNDLNTAISNQTDIDQLSMKYLIVLENLVNGNEMLENSLYSLNLINQLMHMPATSNSNNTGRILYGWQQNGQPPIVYDYLLDKDGKLINNEENKYENDANNTNDSEKNADDTPKQTETNQPVKETETSNDNTTKRTWLTPNIDTYGNYRSNIDTFYNTALLNRFNNGRYGYGMNGFNGYYGTYGAFPNNGNGFYGYNNMNNGYMQNNPYFNNNFNNSNQNLNYNDSTINSDQSMLNTQDNVNTNKPARKKKQFKLNKNIDTYRDENTPTPAQRFSNIKDSVLNFFSKFRKPEKDKIKNPIYEMKNEENSKIK